MCSGGSMRSILIVFAVTGLLAGCAGQRQAALDKQKSDARIQAALAEEECMSPASKARLKTAEQITQCFIDAGNIYNSRFAENPDLVQISARERLRIARQIDNKEISPEEGIGQFSRLGEILRNEQQKRGQEKRMRQAEADKRDAQVAAAFAGIAAVGAGVAAASAASQPKTVYIAAPAPTIPRPITCRTFYRTTTCQ